MAQDATPLDRLLIPWLTAQNDEEAEQRLAQLLASEIEPVIRTVIRFKVRLGTGAPDEEDLRQEAVTELLSQLYSYRSEPTRYPIEDVRGLAATITYRVCYRWWRRQSPNRSALRNRLQYVLTRKPGLGLWPGEAKRLLAGLARWRGRNDCASSSSLEQVRHDLAVRAKAARVIAWQSVSQLVEFLEALFSKVDQPIELDELVILTGELLQVRDEKAISMTSSQGGEIAGVVSRDNVGLQVEKRLFVGRMWEEVLELPLQQRTALLLNLRDEGGRSCIELFPAIGVASIRHLAAALEMQLEQLAGMWNQLPLDDAAIGELLNLERQQVINLRKAARRRLTRRLRGFF